MTDHGGCPCKKARAAQDCEEEEKIAVVKPIVPKGLRSLKTTALSTSLLREFNQHISQCGMCIPIAFCSIAIVVVVWLAVGLCFPAKTFFSMRFVEISY